jgi:hypothetical protein
VFILPAAALSLQGEAVERKIFFTTGTLIGQGQVRISSSGKKPKGLFVANHATGKFEVKIKPEAEEKSVEITFGRWWWISNFTGHWKLSANS